MTERGDHISGGGPLTEEQLVDWIDGGVSPEEAARLARASGRADLPARIAQMQRQKALMASLDDERAPAELYDRVMAAVERDVLLGVAQGPGPGIVEPRLTLAGERESVGGRVSRVVQGNLPRLALAAGLMLMVAGLAYFGSVAWKAVRTPVVPGLAGTSGGNGGDVGPLAVHEPGPGRLEPELSPAAPESTDGRSAKTTSIAAADHREDQAATPAGVSVDRAVELAGEGRLAIRVLAQKPENLARIERDLSKPRAERQWRMTRGVPAEVVAAVVPARRAAGAPAMAGETRSALSLIGPFIGPGAAVSMITAAADPLARVKGTYLVDLPMTREQLGVVAAVFKNQLSASVVFEELPGAVDARATPQAQDVLWWTQAPGQWVPRATVPVVVEQR